MTQTYNDFLLAIADGNQPVITGFGGYRILGTATIEELHQLFGFAPLENTFVLSAVQGQKPMTANLIIDYACGEDVEWTVWCPEHQEKNATWKVIDEDTPIEVLQDFLGMTWVGSYKFRKYKSPYGDFIGHQVEGVSHLVSWKDRESGIITIESYDASDIEATYNVTRFTVELLQQMIDA